MAERILSQVQAAEMGFFQRVQGAPKGCTKVRALGGRNKFGVPMFDSEAYWESMYCIEEKTCNIVETFQHLGHCAYLAEMIG